ncbi:hypothetical protein DFH29DRAFT_365082 [Suillus ampliporus]|nr:hypothetical protein DFH29DRAFT_365082 [Suillus ampliporus]
MQTTNSTLADLSPVWDIIGALQTVLAGSPVIRVIPGDLETPYSRFPNTDPSAIELSKDLSVSAIVIERQQQVDEILHAISGLDTVMNSIKSLHRQLVEKKDMFIQSLNLHKGLVSALWRLPTELLSQIFGHCLPELVHNSPTFQRKCPMLLTKICRRWREVAVNTPSLWCKLSVGRNHRDRQLATFRYDSWLKRSQGRPLSLAVSYYDDDSTKLRSLFQPYINQISSLSVRFDYGTKKPELMVTDLLALQELTISGFSRDMPAIARYISQQPPTLRSLKVEGPSSDLEGLSSFNPVWAHLTNVEIALHQPSAVFYLLQLCPNLSSLSIRAAFSYTQSLEPFTHTKLQSFRIACDSRRVNQLSDLFNAISFPNLRVLEARYIPWPHEELKAFLVRSRCPLESLILGIGVKTTYEQREEYIALIPSLKIFLDTMHDGHFA